MNEVAKQKFLDEIEAISAQYTGKTVYTSKKEKYQAEWKPSPMAQGVEITRTEFTYDIMRLALHFTVTNQLKKEGKNFHINADNSKRLTRILKSITGCTTGEYNPACGIFMYGPPSSGKTFIMKMICHTISRAYYTQWYTLDSPAYFFSYKDITMKARENGSIDFLRTYFDNRPIIFLDDLGYNQENQLTLFGNKENIISHLIDILYRKYIDNGYMIHITSNLTMEYILSNLGQHTHDRIAHMCTPVSWMGDNFRVIK